MLRPIATLTILIIILISAFPVDSAIADPAVCYWQSNTGQTIDLSSLCGQATPSTRASTPFQSLLKSYPPNIQQNVTQHIQQNQASVIAQAKTTCRILRYGGQQAATTRRQALTNYLANSKGDNEASQARQATIDAYAIANYCPEFAK
jgi:hypothetical protein